ncbi:BQ5605_C005g03439 [Microbotryum silenes-dioicae]|uniref:3-hydroxyisobutyryl-CoA hydrolase n=1 Tax=Microbotryum silenes-dioicae TaxID=796604 RepID=A0A2X0MEU9_9BASI|nr:BQ5605_C005g03439 [Microbotryum silenes-dioicae]
MSLMLLKTCKAGAATVRMVSRTSSASASRVSMIGRHLTTSQSAQSSSTPSASSDPAEPLVRFESLHSLRKATLNRPAAFNALNKEMVDLLQPQLEKWEASDLASVIVLRGTGKHFCAGGDVKNGDLSSAALAKQLATEETWADSANFFGDEYVTDHFIANMRTPVVAFIHGNTLGGGCGLSMHAPFRIATETTILGMPETNIGLFPDVGANFFLPRLDGELGVYLGLTGHTLRGKDALFAGFASHFVPSERLNAVEARLSELGAKAALEDVNAAIEEFVADAEELQSGPAYPLVGAKRRAIDAIFGRKTVESIITGLSELESGSMPLDKLVFEGEEVDIGNLQQWAKTTREVLEHRSPTSLKLTLKAIREGAKLDIDEVFAMDLRIATACCVSTLVDYRMYSSATDSQLHVFGSLKNPTIHPDFRVGVTHLLVDKRKDRAPWSPSSLAEVEDSTILKNFFSNPAPFSNPPVKPLQKRAPESARPYREYPHARFSLPSERQIKDIVTGEAKGSGKFAMTKDEVVARVAQEAQRLSGGAEKIGLREKVNEVLQRKCRVGEQGTLRWVSSSTV